MFDTQIFGSWPAILVGALFFACLFTLVGVMSDFVFEGIFRLSKQSIGFSILAFAGYLLVALAIKQSKDEKT